MTAHERAANFNFDADNGDRVCLCYVSSMDESVQDVVGEVTDSSNPTEFTEVTEDETGDVYRMCGMDLAGRDLGEIVRDGSKVGEFDSVWEVRS